MALGGQLLGKFENQRMCECATRFVWHRYIEDYASAAAICSMHPHTPTQRVMTETGCQWFVFRNGFALYFLPVSVGINFSLEFANSCSAFG